MHTVYDLGCAYKNIVLFWERNTTIIQCIIRAGAGASAGASAGAVAIASAGAGAAASGAASCIVGALSALLLFAERDARSGFGLAGVILPSGYIEI